MLVSLRHLLTADSCEDAYSIYQRQLLAYFASQVLGIKFYYDPLIFILLGHKDSKINDDSLNLFRLVKFLSIDSPSEILVDYTQIAKLSEFELDFDANIPTNACMQLLAGARLLENQIYLEEFRSRIQRDLDFKGEVQFFNSSEYNVAVDFRLPVLKIGGVTPSLSNTSQIDNPLISQYFENLDFHIKGFIKMCTLAAQENKTGKNTHIHLFCDRVDESLVFLMENLALENKEIKITPQLNNCSQDDLSRFFNGDILVLSNNAFSWVASILSRSLKLTMPGWQYPVTFDTRVI